MTAHKVERTPVVLQEPAGQSKDLNEALRGMADRPFLGSVKHQEYQWRAVRDGAHPDLLEFERVFLRQMAKQGIPMYAHSMVRSANEQRALFDRGASRDSPRDGIWPHKGCAVDLVHSVFHWNLTPEQWLLVGHIGKDAARLAKVKVEWGGDWKKPGEKLGWDPAHWQLAGWRMLMGGFPWRAA